MQTLQNARFVSTLCVTLLALCGAAAQAQTLLDHNRAMSGNATPGDAPGYPITLSQPGHYVLKSNLSVPDGLSGIVIQTEGVTLDLNGFTIKGSRSCSFNGSNFTVGCSTAGGLYGITSNYSSIVRNGFISGFHYGVYMSGGLAEALTVRHNNIGILSTNNSATRITGVLAELSSVAGIFVDVSALVDNVVASLNTIGIDATNATIRDSAVTYNNIGIRSGATRATRIAYNKSDVVGTSAY